MSRLRRAAGDLRLAASTRAVWFGFLGSFCILIGSLSPAYLPQASPIWDVLRALSIDGPVVKWVGTILTLLGLALMLESWFRLRPSRRVALGQPQLRHWAVLLIIAAPFVLGPPIFSHDAYSYAAHGWLIHNHLNPYDVGPGVLPGYYADQVSWVWRETPAPYGPLALKMSQPLVWLAGYEPFASAILMRVPALIGVGLIGYLVPRLARRMHVAPEAASWFVTLNPILVIDYVGGAHNDSLMTGLMLLGIWIAARHRAWWWGAVAIGVAASIKQPAFLAAVALPFLVKPWTSWTLRPTLLAAVKALLSLGIAVAVFAGITWATGLGFGWINAVNVPGMVDTVSPFTILGHIVQFPVNALGLDSSGRAVVRVFRGIGVVVGAAGIVALAVRYLGKQPLRFVSWSLIWFALCAPAIHSWYLLWGAVLLPMTRPSQRLLRSSIVMTVILLAYGAANFGIRNGLGMMAVLLAGAVYWITHSHELSQSMDEDDEDRRVVGQTRSGLNG
ncbi:polyprenol phosphomannose-dependent alpha 1,6 mannosyltransferase MptB [Tessaracoccus caeni]|uniref:polyprenol phosphomannose-dependent alpha 1,6 mannosyltransferase MptB n=1 Tax=Tessaracoccus caeni TaxID=3031239 RepID=UPI0023DB5805|nr:polyprenol phosphomannose-dependent alpha 1,6 mannosyltransferase MptB [Tessaracoccus caeni]MDF1487034.1 polyprenol phosphomannose-dependent alpha 1,6 mannosyltransferase MptB [Tessaracoccus caeni]